MMMILLWACGSKCDGTRCASVTTVTASTSWREGAYTITLGWDGGDAVCTGTAAAGITCDDPAATVAVEGENRAVMTITGGAYAEVAIAVQHEDEVLVDGVLEMTVEDAGDEACPCPSSSGVAAF